MILKSGYKLIITVILGSCLKCFLPGAWSEFAPAHQSEPGCGPSTSPSCDLSGGRRVRVLGENSMKKLHG